VRMLLKLIKAVFYLALILAVAAFVAGVVVVVSMRDEIPQLPDRLEKLVLNTRTEFYSSSGSLISTIGEKNRVPLERISPNFIQALLAAEDDEFYLHHGIDKKGILRALLQNVRAGRIEGGASTLTQQLARNFFFTLEQTHIRKLKEILLAFQLEYMFDKKEILEAYCNNMYFGSGAYGVEAASRTYFACHADQLSLGQASLLVAILNGPSLYSPYRHPGRARTRQLWILQRMVELGMLEPQARLAAEKEEITLRRYTEGAERSSYFLDYVQDRIRDQFGEEFLYYGGLKVFTTLDPALQSAATSAVRGGLRRLDSMLGLPDYGTRGQAPADYPQGALVAVETGTGAILALVGGRDYYDSQFNRALHQNRLPGSSFKPLVYYTAMRDLGLSPASTLIDSAVTFRLPSGQTWSPGNFEQNFLGRMTLKKALTLSRNVISAELIEMVGPDRVVETARQFGIQAPLSPTPALSLGASGVSPLEMAGAYAVLASGGIYHEPYAIRRIEDYRGNVIYDPVPRGQDVANPQVVYQLVDMMQSVVDHGTGQVLRRLGFQLPAAGKTGTTSDYRDSWFVGFTPGLSCAAWVGYDDNREMRFTQNGRRLGVTGARGGAPIWALFMNQATAGRQRQEFPIPPGIEFLEVNAWSGLPADEGTAAADRMTVPLLPEQLEAARGATAEAGAADQTAPPAALDTLEF